MTGNTLVSIGICTYRRASVANTLESLSAQILPRGVSLRIVVADNDAEPEAEARVRECAAVCGIDVSYVHAPSRNICIARNACLDAATGDWIAFLDDDETVAPNWLAALLAEAQRSGCDAVLGPVQAVYGDRAPGWMKTADLHSTRPVVTAGAITKGYAGNVLIRRDAIEARGLRFDLALGRSGGEDDDFFYRLTDSGGTIGFAPGALAYEPVPAERSTLGWLMRRGFRTGQTHGARLNARHRGPPRALQMGLAAAKGMACLAAAAGGVASTGRRNRWLVRGSLHAGVVARLAGMHELQLY
jgi:succinoglycan biosynthesis protein ExoM